MEWKLEENLRVAVAEYEFKMFPLEDWGNPRESLKLVRVNVLDDNKIDLFPIPLEYKNSFTDKENKVLQGRLDELALDFVHQNNRIFGDVQYKKINLNYPNRVHSAVMRYDLIYNEFTPTGLFIWYFIETMDFSKFFIDDAISNFNYEESTKE